MRDVIGFCVDHLRNPVPPTDGIPRQGLLCAACAASVQATIVSLYDLVDGPVRALAGQDNRYERRRPGVVYT